MENFLLVPAAIDRAAQKRISDREKRTGAPSKWSPQSEGALLKFTMEKKGYVFGQCETRLRQFERKQGSSRSDEVISAEAFKKFEEEWQDSDQQLKMVPGKEALSFLNALFQEKMQIAITPTGIIDAMHSSEIPGNLTNLIKRLEKFANLAEESD